MFVWSYITLALSNIEFFALVNYFLALLLIPMFYIEYCLLTLEVVLGPTPDDNVLGIPIMLLPDVTEPYC